MHTSVSSVMFTPFNFHDRDPSRHSVQGVRLDLKGGHPQPHYFGGRYETGVHLKVVSLFLCGKSNGRNPRLLALVYVGEYPFNSVSRLNDSICHPTSFEPPLAGYS
jgi:hypothetical protein